MKPLIFLTCLLMLACHVHSQDKQWLVFNGKAKDGTNAAGTLNNYAVSLTNSEYTISGVTLPDTHATKGARNDLLIIYADGKHFNSRYSDRGNPGFFYNEIDASNNVSEHNFKNSPGGIRYMYMSNIYEADDPPRNVRMANAPSTTGTATYTPGATAAGVLTANHDVVLNKDLTVIVRLDSLIQLAPSAVGVEGQKWTLKYNQIRKIGTNDRQNINFLNLSNSFYKTAGVHTFEFPSGAASTFTTNVLALNPGTSPYGYISFKPNSLTQNYGPGPDGRPQYEAVFSLMRGTQEMRILTEPIMLAHDPNYLRVDSICKAGNGSFVVFYTLHFENTSTQPANTLAAQIRFPGGFNLNCLHAIEWFAGNSACTGTIKKTGNTAIFTFQENEGLIKCSPTQTACEGYVRFRIKHNSGYNLLSGETGLEPDITEVSFDGVPFAVTWFIDDLYMKSGEWFRHISNGPCKYCDPVIDPRYVVGGLLLLLLGVAMVVRRRRRRRK